MQGLRCVRWWAVAMLGWALLTSQAAAETPAPSSPPPEVSAEDDEKARVLYLNGQRMYEEGRYEDAILAFQSAYDLSPRPLLLYNLANAHERLGQLPEAIDALNRYRIYADPQEQDILLARVQTLERRLEQQRVQPVPLPIPAPIPAPVVPQPVPTVPVRRSKAPWVVAVSGSVLALAGAGTAGFTYASSRTLLEGGDEAGWNRLRPINNAGFVSAVAGAAVGTIGLTWGAARAPAAADER